ncbi:hypothetical protein LOK49_LG08G03457 [Camellia lanceoleosa]|uniref:Uncharacterized protein n=1 Tax=Camellia lanceoleosa TaxID=1840588 RepID=A0ACC0GPK8_9ERIC|nr:hypothetical protein LOK49_LG08G03457 [Camellia lanceoleosa]
MSGVPVMVGGSAIVVCDHPTNPSRCRDRETQGFEWCGGCRWCLHRLRGLNRSDGVDRFGVGRERRRSCGRRWYRCRGGSQNQRREIGGERSTSHGGEADFWARDLENLLQTFLSLNSYHHHKVIVHVYTDIWDCLRGLQSSATRSLSVVAESATTDASETLIEAEPSIQDMDLETPIAATEEQLPAADSKRSREDSGEDGGGAKKLKVEKSAEEDRLDQLEGTEGDKESDRVSVGPKNFGSSVEMFDYFYKFLHY